MELAGQALMVVGAAWLALAAAGVVKFRDVFARMQATTKATSMGLWLVILGAGLQLPLGDAAKLVMTGLLVFLTAPVGMHLIARSVYRYPGSAHVEMDACDELDESR